MDNFRVKKIDSFASFEFYFPIFWKFDLFINPFFSFYTYLEVHYIRSTNSKFMKTIFTLIFFSCIIALSAQNINGFITDESKSPLEYVFVYNQTTEVHTHTDKRGYYSLPASSKDSIVVSHIGYKKSIFEVQDKKNYNINLKSQNLKLDEVQINYQVNPIGLLTEINQLAKPVNSAQELLQIVPGLMIGQHAGGG